MKKGDECPWLRTNNFQAGGSCLHGGRSFCRSKRNGRTDKLCDSEPIIRNSGNQLWSESRNFIGFWCNAVESKSRKQEATDYCKQRKGRAINRLKGVRRTLVRRFCSGLAGSCEQEPGTDRTAFLSNCWSNQKPMLHIVSRENSVDRRLNSAITHWNKITKRWFVLGEKERFHRSDALESHPFVWKVGITVPSKFHLGTVLS